MLDNLRNKKFICMLLVIISILSLFSYMGGFLVSGATGSEAAFADGGDLYGTSYCVCAPTYSVIEKSKASDGTIKGTELKYSLTSSTTGVCSYASGGKTISVECNKSQGSKYMKKYIDAGIFKDDAAANDFYNKSYAYAGYVQQSLSTKTQANNGIGNSGWSDLGNGQFQRAMFEFNNNAHYVYSFLIGFAFVTAMLVFILIFMKITWLPDHPIKRREAMEDIITSGVSVILTGGIWVVISLFQSIFDRFWSSYAVYSKDWRTVANMFLYEYKGLVIGILGIAALTALLMLIKNFVGLTFSGDNPNARKQKMISILLCGIATAGLGGLAIVMGFFWNML